MMNSVLFDALSGQLALLMGRRHNNGGFIARGGCCNRHEGIALQCAGVVDGRVWLVVPPSHLAVVVVVPSGNVGQHPS